MGANGVDARKTPTSRPVQLDPGQADTLQSRPERPSIPATSDEFRGVFAIMATPFGPDEELDTASLRDLVTWELARRVHGLTILGIFGEAHMLSDEERVTVIRSVVDEVGGRVPVVVGTGHNSPRVAGLYSRQAEELGANAVMVFPSPFAKSAEAVHRYYETVAQATSLPLVIQDEPTFTGVALPASLLAEVAAALPSARYVKLEEAPTPPKVTEVGRRTDRLSIFGGLGGVFFLEELFRGAVGTMTGFAFPELLVEIYDAYIGDKRDEARSLFNSILPVLRYENQPGIGLAIRKELLRRRGAIRHSTVRQPARALGTDALEELDELLRSFARYVPDE